MNDTTKNENFLRLLMLNKETDQYFTAELKPSLASTPYIKSYTIELRFFTDPP